MREYFYTKVLGSSIGIATILAAFGYGFFALIGLGLSSAWGSGQSTAADGLQVFTIFIVIFIIGLITSIGSFMLELKGWRVLYLCLTIAFGISFLIVTIISWGALGKSVEIFLLTIGVLYFLESYLAYKRK